VNEGAIALAAYRKAEKVSQKWLADKLGWFVQEISAYETGVRKPSRDRAVILRDSAGVPVDSWGQAVEPPKSATAHTPSEAQDKAVS